MSLRKLKVSTRAALGFGLIGLVVALLGIFALKQMTSIRDEAGEVSGQWLPSIIALGQLNEHTLRLRIHALRLVADRAHVDDNRSTVRQFVAELKPLEEAYKNTISVDEEQRLYDDYLAARQDFETALTDLQTLEASGRLDDALRLFSTRFTDVATAMSQQVRKLVSFNNEQATKSARRADELFAEARMWMIATILFAAIFTCWLAWVFTQSIVKPLIQAVEVAEVVASGDLTQSIEVEGNDEPARLLLALKRMQGSLRETVQRIADSSNQLASAAEELNVVTEASTRGLHQQNQEIEQAATAVNEMTSAVDEVASNAVATSEASRDTDATTQRGRQQVVQTVESIDLLAKDVTLTATEVNRLANQVGDISKVLVVIRSIAEQTNLLALNAAIEAARAGDAGRGFAVVADEVRALAHRTQQSTQEIEQMISDVSRGTETAVQAMQSSTERAMSTLERAQAAGDALDEIAHAISQISERNLVIASASEEQAQVAREVDRNLVNIRDLSIQSAAGANQTSAASQELARLAIELNELVGRFNV